MKTEKNSYGEMEYLIFCGGVETMQSYAKRGVKALNKKTMKWQIVEKSAKYEVIETKRWVEDGKEHIMADLTSDKDLRSIAIKKGLIV